ncbi:kinase-like domain-containing protein [Sphaerosporella brunnea]|uniref:Kinase-like domain-containing protein n=1 Tax=Sphaerosporella brunnea TaxID=1250544 RepID=A0A5J5EUH2_9PEZI|nr:kinase-like domain-containing protein [Sphaerosporella brunnea]
MFSNHSKPKLVQYASGIFSHIQHSAATTSFNDAIRCDLIAFFAIAQKCNVAFLPIMWQPALGTLGEGGSGVISQSTVSSKMSFAFKRFHESGDPEESFLPQMSEVLILSQAPVRAHRNIVNLEGICWEIMPMTQKAVPVLVFEKAAWDLQQFMKVQEGMNMSTEERLNICTDIGSAIMALHAYGVIHGDIKPQNILVYKDETGTTIKVADFGYSTLTAGEAGTVVLPRSRPWNAPEHHFGDLKASEAKSMDVYSFGMLCLWILLGSRQSETLEGTPEFVSFDVPHGRNQRTVLEESKVNDGMGDLVIKLLQTVPGLSQQHQARLKKFFSVAIAQKPENRTSDIPQLVNILNPER